ncbi:MAG TPA: hypothetical protein VGM18_14390 [Candidatus Sulfotelmatobacter sp.]|jgi:hypothetical protein
MIETISAVVSFLVSSLQQADPRPLKGSQLAVLAKTSYPDFRPEKYGFRTFREFIHKNAPEIAESSRAGMDVSYRLRATEDRLKEVKPGDQSSFAFYALDQLTRNPRVWKTFASPDSAFRLYRDPENGALRTMHSNSKPLPHWQEVPRVSAEALLKIGRDFTADLDDSKKLVLTPLLEDPKWWIPFYERIQGLGLKSKWVEFRRQRIREEFQRLVGAAEKPAQPPSEPALSIGVPTAEVPARTISEPSIRRIAADVVQRMTEPELRALNLPLGYVMDSLTMR